MRALVAFCILAGTSFGRGAIAQAPSSGPDSSVPTLKVNTRLTLVDVTVTDAKGHPVHGLTQPDFALKEDNKLQLIKNFEEYGTGDVPPVLPPNVYSNRLAPSGRAVNILLLDQVTTGLQPTQHQEAFEAAKIASMQFIKTMPAGTQVAVMEIDGSGLHTMQAFTSDRELLLAAVKSVTFRLDPESDWSPPQSHPEKLGLPPEKPNYAMLCSAMNFHSSQVLNALNQMTLFVSGVPGRKNLIWFTPGTPWLTNYAPVSQSPNLACVSDFTQQLHQVYGRLNTARIALYPINPFGAGGFSDSIEDLAKATGGKAHADNDFAGSIREDVATGADYYALSYVPPLSKYDGKYHTIEVKVDRPGVHLEYRRGYTSLDLDGPLLEQEKAHGKPAPAKNSFQTAMGYGAAATTQIGFAVRALPATGPQKPGVIGSLNTELKGKPLARYSFAFDVPRDKITLEERPDGTRKASYELAVAAYDVQGRVLNSLDEKRSFILKADAVAAFLQKPFVVPVEIDLPTGALSVRAGVEDLPSEETGVVEIPLKVSAP